MKFEYTLILIILGAMWILLMVVLSAIQNSYMEKECSIPPYNDGMIILDEGRTFTVNRYRILCVDIQENGKVQLRAIERGYD